MKKFSLQGLLAAAEPVMVQALLEDLGRGDRTSLALVPEDCLAQAKLIAKSDFILAGWPIAKKVFTLLDPELRIQAAARDGRKVKAEECLALLCGRARPLLVAERTALNYLQQLSGIATLTARFVQAAKGTQARIAATRKTHPGLMRLEKYAVMVGGGVPHRLGLGDGILIKDNHLALTGSIGEAVRKARAAADKRIRVEVEVEDLDQLDQALAAGADIILLDNMSLEKMRRAVNRVRGRAWLEASGGVTLRNVARVARTGVDLISVGALTHSAPAVDISLEIEPGQRG